MKSNSGLVNVVKDVSLDIKKGEIVALVGESGSGKTMTALSIVGLLPEPHAKIASGNVFFEGERDLAHMEQEETEKNQGEQDFHDFPRFHDCSKSHHDMRPADCRRDQST